MAQFCCIECCGKPAIAKKLCQKHYYRDKKYGSADGGIDYQKRAKDRFLKSFVKDSSGCHVWVKSKDRNGYGKISILRKSVQAHRYSWEMYNNQKIPDDMVVMHLCNNKCCVNPEHLKIGSRSENSAHAVMTNRARVNFFGEDQVRFIRASNATSQELAAAFGVTFSCIDDIRKFKTWKNL